MRGLAGAVLATALLALPEAVGGAPPTPKPGESWQVRFADGAGNACGPRACAGPAAAALTAIRRAGGEVRGCYGLPVGRLRALMAEAKVRLQRDSGGRAPVDLTQCFEVGLPPGPAAPWLSRLRGTTGVVEVAPMTPLFPAQGAVPSFADRQFVLDAPPAGMGVRDFTAQLRGQGEGITVVDIELSLDAGHMEMRGFPAVLDGPGAGTTLADTPDSRDHGLACVGMIVAPADGHGIDGIAPGAVPLFYSAYAQEYTWGAGSALLRALAALRPGDVVLLEVQRPGPLYDPAMDDSGQWGMVPVEWLRADYDAIRTATDLGVTVVEAAGNGFQDLDDPIYGGVFTDARPDSGALLVGAGNPADGSFGPPRAPMFYSNHGRRVSLQGAGASIVTAGYGDLWGEAESADRYTSVFAGTSAAAPQVAGAAVLLQGLAGAAGGVIPPRALRDVLVETGQAAPGEGIGPFPDLVAAAAPALARAQPSLPSVYTGPWASCRGAADCDAALTCVAIGRGERYCLAACEPFATPPDPACRDGEGCALQVWGGGVCTARTGWGGAGDPCTSELDCNVNFFCDPEVGCVALCSQSRGLGCAPGETCLFSGEDLGDWGVCDVESPNPAGADDGEACFVDADCRGGTCLGPGGGWSGLCTTAGCRNAADCAGPWAECGRVAGAVPYCLLPCGSPYACPADALCVEGYCWPSAICAEDADCPAGARCGDARCRLAACLADADCGGDQRCVAGACVAGPECDAHGDCPVGQWCRAGVCEASDACGSAADCRAAERCVGGHCMAPGACRQDEDCAGPERCVRGVCEVEPDPPCPLHRRLLGAQCVPDGTCDGRADCPGGYECEAGRCVRLAVCEGAGDCRSGFVCRDGTCRSEDASDAGGPALDATGSGTDLGPAPAGGADALPAWPQVEVPPSVPGGRGCACREGGGPGSALWLPVLAVLRRRPRRRRR